jgi:molybdopterin synthase sulfur carrier subunit
MTILIKYFGLFADITKLKEEQLTFDGDCITVSDLKTKIESNYEKIQNAVYNIAVNQTIVGLQETIKENDEVAFLPPFAGG